MGDIYQFDTEYAKKYGLAEAVILQNIIFWVKKNKANRKHFNEGKHWTYNTVDAFVELFDFLTPKQIRRALDSLRENKALLTGNFNHTRYDRTLWYTLSDELYAKHIDTNHLPFWANGFAPDEENHLPKKANGFAPKGEPIPDFKPNFKNTDEKTHTDLRGNIMLVQNEQAQEKQNPVCEDALSTEKLRQNTKAFLKGDRDRIPLAKYGISEQEATPTNTKTDLTQREEITTHTVAQTPMAKPREKPVHSACKPLSLQELQKAISETIGENFGLHQLKLLVRTKGQQKIQYHLAHWHIHRQRQTKSAAGYFNYVVINDMEPVLPEKKPYYQGNQVNTIPQRDNFEQRDYSDDFLESFYANLTVE
jgi:hypothetical protein